jgi:hypothetical protein
MNLGIPGRVVSRKRRCWLFRHYAEPAHLRVIKIQIPPSPGRPEIGDLICGGTAVSYAPLCRFGRYAVRTGIGVGVCGVRWDGNSAVMPESLSRGTWLMSAVIRS